jgi:predicted PolB exonuclease-like 3'-5' exonuclease
VKTYEFDFVDDDDETMAEMFSDLIRGHASFSVEQNGPGGGHPVLRVRYFDEFEGWFKTYFDVGDPIEIYEVKP